MTLTSAAPAGRLRDSRDIVAVLRDGRHRAGRLVVLHTRPQTAADPADPDTERVGPRLAVVASRKVGNAVNRNRAKRLLREAARRIDWAADTDVVLVARNSCASSTTLDVLAELEELAGAMAVGRHAA